MAVVLEHGTEWVHVSGDVTVWLMLTAVQTGAKYEWPARGKSARVIRVHEAKSLRILSSARASPSW
jgi:hypothetical protein